MFAAVFFFFGLHDLNKRMSLTGRHETWFSLKTLYILVISLKQSGYNFWYNFVKSSVQETYYAVKSHQKNYASQATLMDQ